jgi:pimeloyl-ACP methyl ester carboxylesterase
LVLLNSMSSDAALWRQEEAALSDLITEEDKAELQIIRESDAFGRMEPFAIASMLTVSFKPQFYDRANVGSLELYVPPDYADRSRQFGFMIADLMNFNFTSDLRSVEVPTLIVYGDIEPGAKISGPVLDEALPNSELVILENAGHFPFIEQRQTTLDTIRAFLGDKPRNKSPG